MKHTQSQKVASFAQIKVLLFLSLGVVLLGASDSTGVFVPFAIYTIMLLLLIGCNVAEISTGKDMLPAVNKVLVTFGILHGVIGILGTFLFVAIKSPLVIQDPIPWVLLSQTGSMIHILLAAVLLLGANQKDRRVQTQTSFTKQKK